MGFSKQEYWSGLPYPSSGDLPYSGIKPVACSLTPFFLIFKLLAVFRALLEAWEACPYQTAGIGSSARLGFLRHLLHGHCFLSMSARLKTSRAAAWPRGLFELMRITTYPPQSLHVVNKSPQVSWRSNHIKKRGASGRKWPACDSPHPACCPAPHCPKPAPDLTGVGSRGSWAPWVLPQAELSQGQAAQGWHLKNSCKAPRARKRTGQSSRGWPSETCCLQSPWSLGPKEERKAEWEGRRLPPPEPGASREQRGKAPRLGPLCTCPSVSEQMWPQGPSSQRNPGSKGTQWTWGWYS